MNCLYITVSTNFAAYLHVPPPVARPHFSIFSVGVIIFSIDSYRLIILMILERRILHQFSDTFNRVAMPEFNILHERLPILIAFIARNTKGSASPLRSLRKTVDTF